MDDAATAKRYLAYWELLKKDPDREPARAGVIKLTPNPPELTPADSIVQDGVRPALPPLLFP